MRHQAIIGAWALTCALILPACETPTSFAGTYEVRACNYAPGGANNSWVWSTNDASNPSHYTSHADCPDTTSGNETANQEGGLSTTDALGLSNGAQPNTTAGWTFETAAGTTITGINYERYIGHKLDPFNDWSPALRADGTVLPTETCLDTVENGETCFVGGPPGHGAEPGVLTGLEAQQLTIGIVCKAPSGNECVTGATQHEAWAAMYGASVTVSDTTPPTIGTPTGPLWEPGKADGFHKGPESVTVSAADVGGGVQSIALAVDGQTRQSRSAACDFTFPQPCPSSTGPQTLTLATTVLSDGSHTVTLTATDAAGNVSSVASEQITVDNDPPPPPANLTAIPTQPASTTFTVDWTDPSGHAAPIVAATYQVCPASGPGVCSTPASAPATGPAIVTVPGPGTWTLAVWLSDAAGNSSPASAAHTTLTVPVLDPGGGNSGGSGHEGVPKVKVRVTCVLHGREFVVRVSGPATGRVHVGFTGRLRGRTVASGAKTIALKHGRSTATFRLGPRTAAHALIRASAKLGHELVLDTLHRRASHRRSTRR